MARVSKAQGYSVLARYYDVFFTGHRKWYGLAREALLGKALTKAKSACDVACGTGSTAITLAGQGLRMFAVDLSSAMCDLARLNAKKARAPVQVLHADMRSFRLPEKVDAVLCEFDAVNHVPHKSDLKLVAQSASRALAPGGHFYFDVNTRRVFQEQWPRPYYAEQGNVMLMMQGGYDAQNDKGWMLANCFVRDGRRWRRLRERIEQVCWTPAEIRQTLREAGFDKIRSVDAGELEFEGVGLPGFPKGLITFYVAQKARNPSQT